ncbi:hypothetical protein METBIDRAFT_69957 [Metschnikowia bicuspidata var. bicuspidata NRRL YB-4993]|uniref:mRNA decay factor PAT1 domain-containing protein n=1 Tax=Metschnikowia bicuspidata var. bicuspidata NRRL YB-4993 TaxID=869754 RepID=A0A1A0HBR0_9ASCO|nr:hypothetical protein METBIDRAFT_69957 [Metschnikowia bicuspidata var. bicuspidata NRRL YB-4993]OBA21420.1 hypothetical protein METBIDRAFT_69957 [Metschnikowia bicuspidata var. bicuspidata NRRL YB-4993]
MSFFGFDSSAPPRPAPHAAAADAKSYDFQDTYEGLGDPEEDDVLNSETFGVAEVGRNFDFHGLAAGRAPVSAAQTRPDMSFARAAAANDDDFMKDLWGDNTPDPAAAPAPAAAPGGPAAARDDRKVLSLQEIEAQLTAIDGVQNRPPTAPQQPFYAAMPAGYGGYMMPQGYMPPAGAYGMPYPGQFMPMQPAYPPPMGQPGVPPMGIPGMPMPPAMGSGGHAAARPADAAGPVNERPAVPAAVPAKNGNPGLGPKPAARSDMSQFPVLGSQAQATAPRDAHQQQQQQRVKQQQAQQQNALQNAPDLLPEEQQRLARRQDKVAKIMKYSGVMNPKDKDFVTRFQLSQIVTEDPYNEDFYAQVYKVIHPKAAPNALGAPLTQQPNSIAQAYLDQSGHRLGGRFKRADVALQRMQQQVQKAVSVAKERQKSTHSAREGVLGKISVGSGKKPRQQLVILSKAAQKAKDQEDDDGDVVPPVQNKTRSPSIAAPSKPIKKYSKKDIMGILEEIINNLMSIESESRTSPGIDTSKLWDSMHVLDQPSSSGDDESYVNPFVQCLNYPKALKVLPRLFKFLSRDQILTVITLVMSNLENLRVIKDGSYTTYESKKLPVEISKLVDIYTLTFCKVLMNAVQDFRFNEILSLLLILAQHNVVSFVSTTKIGLSVITTLLSRAELMKGEGSISATDLSEWSSCYDELFTALESRIAAIFPPSHGDMEDDYVWQFLATLSLGGKLSHQRIIVEEVKDEIFGVMSRAKAIDNSDVANLYKKQSMMNNLNMYLVVMGLVADENEIQELKN